MQDTKWLIFCKQLFQIVRDLIFTTSNLQLGQILSLMCKYKAMINKDNRIHRHLNIKIYPILRLLLFRCGLFWLPRNPCLSLNKGLLLLWIHRYFLSKRKLLLVSVTLGTLFNSKPSRLNNLLEGEYFIVSCCSGVRYVPKTAHNKLMWTENFNLKKICNLSCRPKDIKLKGYVCL